MKVIDIMYKIANGEEVPKKIIYEDEIYTFRKVLNDYENEYPAFEEGIDKYKYLFEDPYGKDYKEFFNEEVEIIEEDKKIEKIKIKDDKTIEIKGTLFYREKDMKIFKNLSLVINEIIDCINGSDKE